MSEVIGKRLPIRKHGREFMALCPFHKEKTPSFTINDDKGFYHCFGCGVHGDTIGFVKEYEGIGWTEAVESLARDAGIPLPVMSKEESIKAKRIDSLYALMDAASKWFEAQLTAPAGRGAAEYLQMRGIRKETIQRFRVGFSLVQRDGLKQHLLKQGATEAQMLEAGLIIQPDSGTSYDRFRGRLMFPIKDITGRIVAFGGRIMGAEDQGPKYLNSPETPLFKKGELLYNFSDARKPATHAGSMVVAEGYMDVIALYQSGVDYAVAPLGTAVTPEQVQLMWRVVKEPTLCLDGDAAGQRAMVRAAEVALPLLQPGCSLKFARLPAGEDPDSLIRTQGREAMDACLAAAQPLSVTLWDIALISAPVATPEQKADLEKRLYAMAERIADTTVRGYYRSYFKQRLAPATAFGSGGQHGRPQQAFSPQRSSSPALPTTPQRVRLEQQLVKLVLLHPQVLASAQVEEQFATLEFQSGEMDMLRQSILTWYGYAADAPLEAAQLQPYIRSAGYAKHIDALLANIFVNAPKDTAQAENFWNEVMGRIHSVKLKEEQQAAIGELASEMTEEALEKFTSLWKLPGGH